MCPKVTSIDGNSDPPVLEIVSAMVKNKVSRSHHYDP